MTITIGLVMKLKSGSVGKSSARLELLVALNSMVSLVSDLFGGNCAGRVQVRWEVCRSSCVG